MPKRDSDESGMQLIGSVQVGGFAGVDNGEAVVHPLEVAVNRDLAGLPTRFSERVHGEEILVYKKQLPASRNEQMSAVQKKWKEIQKPFGATSTSLPTGGKNYSAPADYPEEKSNEPSNIAVLKNFVDKLNDRITKHDSWITILGILAAAGLVLGAIAVMKVI